MWQGDAKEVLALLLKLQRTAEPSTIHLQRDTTSKGYRDTLPYFCHCCRAPWANPPQQRPEVAFG